MRRLSQALAFYYKIQIQLNEIYLFVIFLNFASYRLYLLRLEEPITPFIYLRAYFTSSNPNFADS